jgi:predicted ATPase
VLRRVLIENFRCLKHVDVPLKPLTVLIGPNDTGKTAFLQAIEALATIQRGLSADDYWRRDASGNIVLKGQTAIGTLARTANVGLLKPGTPEDSIVSMLNPVSRIQMPSAGISMECRGYSSAEEQVLPLDYDGQKVPALFDYLLRRDRKRFFSIVEALRQRVPGLEDIDIATPDPALRRIELVIERGLRIPADAASAGVRLLMFFVALAYHPRPPKLVLVEEPENGIHPKRLTDVMQLLREITLGDHGEHPAQVILTTHSPYLLDCVDPEHDQVLVFQRNDDGSRGAQPVDVDRLKTFMDEFMLGEVWFNETEAGLVAKPS